MAGGSTTLMKEEKKVDFRFKFLYVIGIIAVVQGHCKGGRYIGS